MGLFSEMVHIGYIQGFQIVLKVHGFDLRLWYASGVADSGL